MGSAQLGLILTRELKFAVLDPSRQQPSVQFRGSIFRRLMVTIATAIRLATLADEQPHAARAQREGRSDPQRILGRAGAEID